MLGLDISSRMSMFRDATGKIFDRSVIADVLAGSPIVRAVPATPPVRGIPMLARHRSRCLLRPTRLALCTALGLLPVVAAAQEATSADGSQPQSAGITLDTITITATKRATSVQDTPLAVTAITAETLKDTGAVDVKDYARLVPGLSVQDNGPGASRLSMRGIYSTGEATTSVYYDETPVSGTMGTTNDAGGRSPELDLFDVERIEALRGPQGTLYGAGSMGGSVRVIFEKPWLDSFAGKVETGYAVTEGGDPSWNTHLMLNLPLIKDVLGARAVLYKSHSGGYIDNTYLGKDNVNDADREGGRLMLRYKPTDDLTIDASFSSANTEAGPAFWSPRSGVRYGSVARTLAPYEDHTHISNVTLNWDLGWATLTGVSSYFDRTSLYSIDTTQLFELYAAALPAYRSYLQSLSPAVLLYPGSTRNGSNEWRLASNGNEVFDWTTGVFAENRRNGLFSEIALADAASGEALTPYQLIMRRHIYDQLKQQAVFGETTWHATDKLDATLGLRYYRYDKLVTGYIDIPMALIGAPLRSLSSVKADENGWLKKLNVAWHASKGLMFYATVADGMRPGGANQVIGLSEALTAYRSDSLWNYELGAKTSWLDDSLRLNAALYQIDWKDMQITGVTANGSYGFLTNAGKARLRGSEWELTYRPLAGLELGATANYIDAKLVADQINNDVQVTSTLGRKGDRIPYIPRLTASLYGSWRWSLSSTLDGMARVDSSYVDEAYSTFRPTDPARARFGGYATVNARMGVENADGRWSAYLYANNLFDRFAVVTANYNTAFYPQGMAYSLTPRTIGVDVQYNF
jgi:outer membrane receptor protein involved in Fe transport